MRNSPFNYLITLILGALLWIATGMVLGNYLSQNVSLAFLAEEEFKSYYQIVLALTAAIGIVITFLWYLYGAKDSTSLELDQAKRRWFVILVSEIVAAVVAIVAMVILFRDEGLEVVSYVLFFFALAAHTFMFFWVCSFYLSPRSVKYIPLFRR